MATIFERDYRLRSRDLATALLLADRLNPILRSLDLRVGGIEDQSTSISEMEAALLSYGTDRVAVVLAPVVEAIDAAARLGALLTTSSASATEISTGVKTFLIPQPAAGVFAPAAVLSIVADDDPSASMLVRRNAWNATNGLLTVEVISTTGTGAHSSWTISAASVADNAGQIRTVATGGLSGATLAVQLVEIATALAARQPLATSLTALAGLSLLGDRALITDATGAPALAALSAIGKALMAAADKAAARSAIDAAPITNAALLGAPTCPTPLVTADSAQIANVTAVRAAVAALAGSSPAALDTLAELAAALGDDPNFASTIITALAGKQPLIAELTPIVPIGGVTAHATVTDYTRASGASGGTTTYVAASDEFEITPARADGGVYILANVSHQLSPDTTAVTQIQARFTLQYWDGAAWVAFGQPAAIGIGHLSWYAAAVGLRTSAVCTGSLATAQKVDGKYKVRIAMVVGTNNTTALVYDSLITVLEYGAALS